MKIVIKRNTKALGDVETGEFIIDDRDVLWLVLDEDRENDDDRYYGKTRNSNRN